MSLSSRGCRVMLVAAKNTSTIKSRIPNVASTSRWSSTKSEDPPSESLPSKSNEKPVEKRISRNLKPLQVSQVLEEFMGVSETSRSEVSKKILNYVKLHKLQNPSNRKVILCDETLKKIFDGKKTVNLLEMPELLNPHFIKKS